MHGSSEVQRDGADCDCYCAEGSLRLIWGDPPSITNIACAFGSGGPVARDLERLDQVGRFDDESG